MSHTERKDAMDCSFYMPVRMLSGEGCVGAHPEVFQQLGRRCLIVTGRSGAKRSGALDDLTVLLDAAGIRWPNTPNWIRALEEISLRTVTVWVPSPLAAMVKAPLDCACKVASSVSWVMPSCEVICTVSPPANTVIGAITAMRTKANKMANGRYALLLCIEIPPSFSIPLKSQDM